MKAGWIRGDLSERIRTPREGEGEGKEERKVQVDVRSRGGREREGVK